MSLDDVCCNVSLNCTQMYLASSCPSQLANMVVLNRIKCVKYVFNMMAHIPSDDLTKACLDGSSIKVSILAHLDNVFLKLYANRVRIAARYCRCALGICSANYFHGCFLASPQRLSNWLIISYDPSLLKFAKTRKLCNSKFSGNHFSSVNPIIASMYIKIKSMHENPFCTNKSTLLHLRKHIPFL